MEITLFVTPTALGCLLGISKARTYALIAEKKLPKPQRFGRAKGYRLSDALELAAMRRQDSTASGRRPTRVAVRRAA
jgi:predicted DNA-binding transcriptional regulator AlpA